MLSKVTDMTKLKTEYWDSRRNVIYSRRGGWKMGKGVFSHGYNMMEELVGQVSYMQLVVLNATGRLPERRLADWFEAAHICLSWPDPRIWCNHIGALGGTMRTSVMAATCAGTLAADSEIYGTRTLLEGMRFIKSAALQRDKGQSVRNIVSQECEKWGGRVRIMGFARPIAKGDERVPAMERVASELGFTVGKHLDIAYQIEEILIKDFDESMNMTGYMSAFLSDQGFTDQEAYKVMAVWVNSGVTACYNETQENPPESFLPQRCDDIEYRGKASRSVPDNE